MRRIRQRGAGRGGSSCRCGQAPMASPAPRLLLAAALVLAGTATAAAAGRAPLPPAAAPSAASFTHRPHLPSSFAGTNPAAGSSTGAGAAHHHAQAPSAAPRGHHGKKWTTILQQHEGEMGTEAYYYAPAPSQTPITPTPGAGGVGLLAQLQQRQQRRQRDRVRDLLLRAVGGGGQSTQVLERPTVAEPASAAATVAAPASPEWYTTWMDGDAGTLLAPPAFAEGSPYEDFFGGQQAEEEDSMMGEFEGATLLMESYLGPVVTRPTPPTTTAMAASSAVVAIRPPVASRPAVVQRAPYTSPVAPLPQQQQQQVQQRRRERQAGILARAVRGYTSLLEKHYHLVSFVQATLLGVVGDMIAQLIESAARGGGLGPGGFLGMLARFRPNLSRTGNVAMLAAIIDGIVTPQYYDLMERVSPRKTLKVVLLKLIVSLTVYGPLTNGAFLAAVPVLEKGLGAFNFGVWLQQLKEITIRDWQLFSAFYPCAFTIVPKPLRPLANNIMATTFLVILSVLAYGSGGPGAL